MAVLWAVTAAGAEEAVANSAVADDAVAEVTTDKAAEKKAEKKAGKKAGAGIYDEKAVFQGVFLKLDLFTPAYEAIRTKGKMQDYEISASVRLKNHFYPTLEAGASFGTLVTDSATHKGKGGFMRIGIDFNGMRKNAGGPHAFLVGLRVGTAYQNFGLYGLSETSLDRAENGGADRVGNKRWDAWMEVTAGCHVNIAGGFYMGWQFRFKLLLTYKRKEGEALPYYIPGFGDFSDTNWGANYYIGWRF